MGKCDLDEGLCLCVCARVRAYVRVSRARMCALRSFCRSRRTSSETSRIS